MKNNIIKTLFLIFPLIALEGQVGINNENPIATLDIKSKVGVNPLQIKNSNQKEILKIDEKGNLYVGGALKPGGNQGNTNQYLISQGENIPPIWGNFDLENGKLLIQEYNASNNDRGYNIPYFGHKTIDFSNFRVAPSPEIGKWEQGKFKVKKRGLFHITIGLDINNVKSNTTAYSPEIALFLDAGAIYSTGNILYTENGNQHISSYGVVSAILNAGDDIEIVLSMSSNTTGVVGAGFLNIQYTELN